MCVCVGGGGGGGGREGERDQALVRWPASTLCMYGNFSCF